MDRSKELKKSVLGRVVKYKFDKPDVNILETFQNKYPKRDYVINIRIPEFTCICPITGQPDFATIFIKYIPNKECIESKSLKLYICSYRNYGIFYEDSTNKILDDCVKACKPRWMYVIGNFYPRGGIFITPTAEYIKEKYEIPGHIKAWNLYDSTQ